MSFLELFYDLVYVVLIAVAAHHLSAHMDWATLAEFGVVFGLIWIAWICGASVYDLHGREDLRTRVFTFAPMLLITPLAAYATDPESRRDEFAITYGLLFVVLAWLWLAVHQRNGPGYRRVSRILLALVLATVAMMVGSAFVLPSAQIWMWAAVTLVWISTGFLTTRAATELTRDRAIVTECWSRGSACSRSSL